MTYRAVIEGDRYHDFLLSLKDVKYIRHQRGYFLVQGKIHVLLHLDLYISEKQKQKKKSSSSFRKCYTVLCKMTVKVRKWIVLSLYHVYLSRKGWDDECLYRVSYTVYTSLWFCRFALLILPHMTSVWTESKHWEALWQETFFIVLGGTKVAAGAGWCGLFLHGDYSLARHRRS